MYDKIDDIVMYNWNLECPEATCFLNGYLYVVMVLMVTPISISSLIRSKKLSWFDASDECNLYGGYLLHIDTLKQQNCLLDYEHIANIAGWFWQDGE